ncbi:MAG: class I SAM-dependent methyltransferase, partial [Clostridia bacterium]|nr:class I SAM-dependent methyltransferase [Clostridia bacterium]
EYACGEGACGVILSRLGCRYHGVDISPTAVEKAREALREFPDATVEVLDMVKNTVSGQYDGALDCMGFHMLVTDSDRAAYLRNARDSLKDGAPMLFFRQSYRSDGDPKAVYKGEIRSLGEWEAVTGSDYSTPQLRRTATGAEVLIPLVPARANDREGYIAEMERAGFTVENFAEMAESEAIRYAASIYVRKRI